MKDNIVLTSQQQETKNYFQRFAAEWRRKAEGALPQSVNVIGQRNQYVLKIAEALEIRGNTLDVGCGTGELVCGLAKLGFHATGVDFAGDMIRLAESSARDQEILNAKFLHTSIFDFQTSERSELISANGFIEYISSTQLRQFLELSRGLLTDGGSLVIGSRNRLFNVCSWNEYTELELHTGSYLFLVAEAKALAMAETIEDCIEQLKNLKSSLPVFERHPKTGIDVSIRCQCTPSELIQMFVQTGFRPVGLIPIHYHAAVPRFCEGFPEAHVMLAEFMQQYANQCFYLLPSSSSFMLHGIRD